MSRIRKLKQLHFVMKEHLGFEAESGLAHPVEFRTAKVIEIKIIDGCAHSVEIQV